ncbi:receptor expression-enhancing protein 1 isoform X1 [Pangasianodon hypophthalmus]|uniref:receptor expression-enhancing protein 1 isoform X1 n=1 Tax=Pangasianodon hypophthalmus TaxID=310915 RepID=UPI000EFF7116|nr:receptor expression-enhancing protein 1 isoform X1 [Pangasianodon hypophthalmus]
MVSWIISRLVVLIFGTLYPAYSSYKAVKSKDVREYVKWMMYWIIFALFTTAEAITDLFLCWLPFYYELKIAFMVWLLSPYTKGSSVLYRKFVHPTLSSKEKDIDEYLCQAKDKSYDTLMHFGKKSLNVAATAAVMAATKGQGVLSDRLRSFSMHDLTTIESDGQAKSSASVTTQPASGQHRARAMMRSKSDAAYSKRPEFDITEFEMLNVEQFASVEPSSPLTLKPTPIPRSICNPSQSLSPPELFQDKPAPPPSEAPEVPKDSEKEGGIPANSAQLGLLKRRAPEPPPRALRPLTRSRSKNTLSANPEAM